MFSSQEQTPSRPLLTDRTEAPMAVRLGRTKGVARGASAMLIRQKKTFNTVGQTSERATEEFYSQRQFDLLT